MCEVQDDGGLLVRARKGDEMAFSELFGRHQRAIFRYAAYMGGRHVADDVVQDTFMVVLRQAGRHDVPRGSVRPYLMGIARRVLLKRFGVQVEEPHADAAEAWSEPATEQPTALDQLARAETIGRVRAAVESLPSVYREAVVLCELQEMAYAEAARIMDCPVGTVRSRLHRAKSMLAQKLSAVEGVRQS